MTQVYNDFAPHFSYQELIRSNNATRLNIRNIPGPEEMQNLKRLSWYLEALRGKLRAQSTTKHIIIVNSGYRSPELNRLTPGSAKDSAHIKGLAADIQVPSMTAYDLAKFIVKHCRGFDQMILEYGRWVHLSVPEVNSVAREEVLTSFAESTFWGKKTVYMPGVYPTLNA